MALVRTAEPALEPISLTEAKSHLRLSTADEDGLLGLLIGVARQTLERRLERAFVTQGWTLWLDRWPDAHAVDLPMRPLRAVSAVKTYDAGNGATVWAADQYFIDAVSIPGRLIRSGSAWPAPGRPANGIEIVFLAGHGDLASQVPADLRQAMLLLIADLYENRETLAAPAMAPAILELIAPYRDRRL